VQHERKPSSSSLKATHQSRKLMEVITQMLFTWDTQNLCIVFKSWRVTSTMSLFWSLLGVMLLTAGYELIREISRRYEAKVQREIDDMPSKSYPVSIRPQHQCLFAFSLRYIAESTLLKRACDCLKTTIKKEAHCSHQDAQLPTRMQRPKLSRLLYTPFKYSIHSSSCKFVSPLLPFCWCYEETEGRFRWVNMLILAKTQVAVHDL
jgi:hypothetical protein